MLPFLALLAAALSPPAAAPSPRPVTTTASGLRIETLVPGTGPRPQRGNAVLVSYEGRLADGTVFDRTDAPVGLLVSDLVPGFTEALLLMRKGGRYRIWIPPALAYGSKGSPGIIPPNAELEFTIELIDIGHPVASPPRP